MATCTAHGSRILPGCCIVTRKQVIVLSRPRQFVTAENLKLLTRHLHGPLRRTVKNDLESRLGSGADWIRKRRSNTIKHVGTRAPRAMCRNISRGIEGK